MGTLSGWMNRHALRAWLAMMVAANLFLTTPLPAGVPAARAASLPAAGYWLENRGQYDPQARFLFQDGDTRIWLADGAVWVELVEPADHGSTENPQDSLLEDHRRAAAIKLSFPGSNPRARMQPFSPGQGRVTYLTTQASTAGGIAPPAWRGVRYRELYSGIDLVLEASPVGSDAAWTWRLESRPGSDLDAVRLRLEGVDTAHLSENVISLLTEAGELQLPLLSLADPYGRALTSLPVRVAGRSLQKLGGEVIEIASPFSMPEEGNPQAPSADSDLAYSTYLGGSNWEVGNDIAVDASGAAYLVGRTYSADFPLTPGAYDLTLDEVDVFVAKLVPDGASLDYATYIGGSGTDSGNSIVVANGQATLTGETASTDFPATSGAYAGGTDIFVLRLNAAGDGLVYSRLLGGSANDYSNALALENGNAYLTGSTFSTDFPGLNNIEGTYGDAFWISLDGSGGTLRSVRIGGNNTDAGFGIAVRSGEPHVTGLTWSSDLLGYIGYRGNGDGFIARYNSTGARLFGKYLGGAGTDSAYGVAVDASGYSFVTGVTGSSDFTVTHGVYAGKNDAFLARYSPTGTMTTATYLGGTGNDEARSVALDAAGKVYVAGTTDSNNFPVTGDAYQAMPGGDGSDDLFAVRLDLALPGLVDYATYFGGSGHDVGYALALDAMTYGYLTGYTKSEDFPLSLAPMDSQLDGSQDAYVAKLAVGPVPGVTIEKATNRQDADQPPGPYVFANSTVSWSYAVSNTGKSVLNTVTVTDDQGVTVSCPKSSLAVGEAMACASNALATGGQYRNVGTVTANPVGGLPQVQASDPAHYFGVTGGISLEKRVNGHEADAAPGPILAVGSPVTWTYAVTNTSNVTLTAVSVTDDQGVTVSCPKTSLLGAESMQCTASSLAVTGQYHNIGTAQGYPPGGLPAVSANDSAYYYGAAPAITIEKRLNGAEADVAPGVFVWAGATVTWTYLVTNTGNIALNGVTVTDDHPVAVSCPKTSLAVGESMTCSANGVAIVGAYANLGTVTAYPQGGLTQVQASDPAHYFGVTGGISLDKRVNGEGADVPLGLIIAAGQPLTWTYTLSNTSNVTLTNVTVSDDQGVAVSCPKISLLVHEGMVCTASGMAGAGQYANLGMVSAKPPGGLGLVSAQDMAHYYGASPAISLEKRANGAEADVAPGVYVQAGGALHWTYTVTNTGNITLTAVTVADDQGVTVSCPQSSLAAAQAMTCTASGMALAGQYHNLGTVNANPPGGLPQVQAADGAHAFGVVGGITLEKRANGEEADAPLGLILPVGGVVTWTYSVTNTGNVTLTGVTVTDDKDVLVSCPQTSLGVHASMVCTAGGVASKGLYHNTGTARGDLPANLGQVQAQDSAYYFGASPSLAIEKRVNGQSADAPPGVFIPVGEAVEWTYAVTNTGNITLTEVAVSDDQEGSVSCPQPHLGVGQGMVCTASGVASLGLYHNVGKALAQPLGGLLPVQASDPAYYYGSQPGITIQKLINGEDADTPTGPFILAGEPLTWTFVITNSGNITLTAVQVEDDILGTICSLPALPPGQSHTCTVHDEAGVDQHTNLASTRAIPLVGSQVSAQDAGYYFGAEPALSLVKYTNGERVLNAPGPKIYEGETVTWTYHVTNTGNVTVTNLDLLDDQGVLVNCPLSSLNPDQETLCSGSGLATEGQYANTGEAAAQPPVGPLVRASDSSYYLGFVPRPAIELQSLVNGSDADSQPGVYILVGAPVAWEYRVYNIGNTYLGSIVVTDTQVAGITCPKDALAVDEFMTCTVYGVAALGQHSNQGVVQAVPTEGPASVSDSDPSHYFGSQPLIELALSINGAPADEPPGPVIRPGTPVTWTFSVSNPGNVSLTNLAVTDSQLGAVACPKTSLAPYETVLCKVSGAASAGKQSHTGTVSARFLGVTYADDDPVYYEGFPAFEIFLPLLSNEVISEPQRR